MKKKIFQSVFLVCVLCTTATAFCLKNETTDLPPLYLENINALAGGEEGKTIICYGTGSVTCPSSNKKVEGYYVLYSD